MILTKEERTTLRRSIEGAIPQLEKGKWRNLLTVILILLHDLEESEKSFTQESIASIEKNVHTAVQHIMHSPHEVDADYMRNFAVMAGNLVMLTKNVWDLKILLEETRQDSALFADVAHPVLQ